MQNEERVLYIEKRRYEYIGLWDAKGAPSKLGVWHHNPETNSSTLYVSCLLSENYKFEFTEIFIFNYNETTGFTYAQNLGKLRKSSTEKIQKLSDLIMASEPELFSFSRVQQDRLRNMFPAS